MPIFQHFTQVLMFLRKHIIVFFYPLGIIIGKITSSSMRIFRSHRRYLIYSVGKGVPGQEFKMMMDEQYESSLGLIGKKRYFVVKPEKQHFKATIHTVHSDDLI